MRRRKKKTNRNQFYDFISAVCLNFHTVHAAARCSVSLCCPESLGVSCRRRLRRPGHSTRIKELIWNIVREILLLQHLGAILIYESTTKDNVGTVSDWSGSQGSSRNPALYWAHRLRPGSSQSVNMAHLPSAYLKFSSESSLSSSSSSSPEGLPVINKRQGGCNF